MSRRAVVFGSAMKRVRNAANDCKRADLVSSTNVVDKRAAATAGPEPRERTDADALGTLDAVHRATALIWRDRMGPLPTTAKHDTGSD